MRAGSVLILTAGFGEGHNAAARNLHSAFKITHPEIDVVVDDIYAESHRFLNSICQSGYRFAINRYPILWKKVYDFIDKSPSATRGTAFLWKARKLLEERITRYDADVVVSCFPGYASLVDAIRNGPSRPFTYVTIVTDSLSINSIWWRNSTDLFFVPNEPTARTLEIAGVRKDKVIVTGFPVPPEFASIVQPKTIPPPDGLWRVLYMVNSGHHLASGIVTQLLDLSDIELTVTCGKNSELEQKLKALRASHGKNFTILGWTKEMPELIRRSHVVIGKAGGATVQECLAAGTPMVITQVVPGQEEGNARLLLENSAADFADCAKSIAKTVESLFAEKGSLYLKRQAATGPLGHPNGAFDAANHIASVCLHARK